MYSQIRQDVERLERERAKEMLKEQHLDRRRNRLGALDKRNNFNIITGSFDPANWRCTTPFHVQPNIRDPGNLSTEAKRLEYVLLRGSLYKFYAPAWSGDNHDCRQDLLHRNGLSKPKKSSLLGIGRSDLLSVGAEDMFSKSIYDPDKACQQEGIFELSLPGRYTPRKAWSAGGKHSSPPPGFRVLPLGLGNGIMTTDCLRGGYTAPPKRMAGSRSAPTLGLAQPPPTKKNTCALGGDATGRQSGMGGTFKDGEGEVSPKDSLGGTMPRGRGGSVLKVREDGSAGIMGRGLSADGDAISTGWVGGSRGTLEKSASLAQLQLAEGVLGTATAVQRRASSGQGGSRAMTPSERREANQVSEDIAAVRSLSGSLPSS
ncbi:unnamed protein product [Discosporangium mesarthrocarpum]